MLENAALQVTAAPSYARYLCLPSRYELECRLFGRRRRLAWLRHGYLAVVFGLDGVAAREQLSAVGDMSRPDGDIAAIDVQDGAPVGQQVLRPIALQASARADVDAPLLVGRDPDRIA